MNNILDDLNDTIIFKEEFEVGSRVISFKTDKMDLDLQSSSFDKTRRYRHWITGESISNEPNNKENKYIRRGDVVMSMEDTKLLSIVKEDECYWGYYKYKENRFVNAQKAIHYAQQKKFPSPAFMRRELFETILYRSILPLSPARISVFAGVLMSGGEQDPAIMAANATSAALTLSDNPWGGPVGVVRIGKIRGSKGFVVNPRMDQINEIHDLDLVYACTKDGTLLVELQACELSNRDVEAALRLAHREAVKYIEPQIRLASRAGKQNRDYKLFMITDDGRDYKLSRITDDVQGGTSSCKSVVRRRIFEKGVRGDGRCLDEVRPLYCESGGLPKLHGSSGFSLGDTQYSCQVSLKNSKKDEIDDYASEDDTEDLIDLYRRWIFKFHVDLGYFRHYSEYRYRYHDSLEKAFLAVLPPEVDFPYDVTLKPEYCDDVSTQSSTTYIATVCGGSLALMDAGIPLKKLVAGVSMGLCSKVDPSTWTIMDYRILTDPSTEEGSHVNMECKIVGTREGVTAIQLELNQNYPQVRVGIGIPLDIICECLEPGLNGRLHILDHMEQHISDAPGRSTPSFIQNGCNWRTLSL